MQEVNAILQQHLETEWASRTDIAWDNVEYVPTNGVEFIRPTLHGVFSERKGMKCLREYYTFAIQVFTAHDSATKNNFDRVDELLEIFANFIQGNLVVTAAYPDRVGITKEWFQTNVMIELKFDKHYT